MKIKKFTIICIMTTILSLSFSLFGGIAWAGNSLEYIKVGLKYGSSSVESCTITSDSNLVLGTASDSGFTPRETLSVNKLIATAEQGVVVIRDESGTVVTSDLGVDGCIMPANYDQGGIINFEGTPYRGGLMLIPSSNKIAVINSLSLEHYVYGVLHSEMGQSNPIEALKAQAVAARSYATANSGNHASSGFHMCNTIHCQVYKGYSGEYASTNKATDDTAGEVIYSQGKPVTAFYFKNSGGYTLNSEDVWYNPTSYLKAIKDIYSPDYPWKATFTFDELKERLENLGKNPGTIQSVAITERTKVGSIHKVEIVGSNSTIVLQKDGIRTTFGGAVVKSLMFDFVDAALVSGGNSNVSFTISNGTNKLSSGNEVYLINGEGTISKKSTEVLYGSNGSNTEKLQATGENTGTGEKIEVVSKSPLSIVGKGYGHGVGMAQDGAIAMAKQGFKYDEILKFYYTGIEIR